MSREDILLEFTAMFDRQRIFRLTLSTIKRVKELTGFDLVTLTENPNGLPDDRPFVAVFLAELARDEDPEVTASVFEPYLDFAAENLAQWFSMKAVVCSNSRMASPGEHSKN